MPVVPDSFHDDAGGGYLAKVAEEAGGALLWCRRLVAGTLSLLLVLASYPSVTAEGREVQVTAAVANVRAQASTAARVIFQVRAGDALKLLEVSGDWYHVEASDGRRGYLFKKLGQERTAPPPTAAPSSPASSSAPTQTLAIRHDEVQCVVAGKHTKIEARFEPGDGVARARTYFRSHGGAAWYFVEMKAAEEGFAGILPRARKDTKRIDYYVQVFDRTFGESRTQEYAPEVVSDAGACSKKTVAAFLPSAKVIVGAPAGAPAIPPGFEAAGLVTDGATTATGAAEPAPGGGAGKKALLIGGGAAAVGLAAVLAGGGGSEAATPSGPSFSNARFSPASVTCTSTQRQNGFFVADILVDARNPAAQPLTISSASDVLTFTSVAPQSGNNVGESIQQASIRFSPSQVDANGSATIQLQAPLSFRFPASCRALSGTSQLAAELTIVTSNGTFRVQTTNTFSLIYP
jgi:hypothetical protein